MTPDRVRARVTRWLVMRKCKACDTRYRRKLPNCPVCKTKPGLDGIDRGHTWASGIGIGIGGPPGGGGM